MHGFPTILAVLHVLVAATLCGGCEHSLRRDRGEEERTPPGPRPDPPRFHALSERATAEHIAVSGRAEPEATVEIHVNGLYALETLAGPDGYFQADGVPLATGENLITGVTVDREGRRSGSPPAGRATELGEGEDLRYQVRVRYREEP